MANAFPGSGDIDGRSTCIRESNSPSTFGAVGVADSETLCTRVAELWGFSGQCSRPNVPMTHDNFFSHNRSFFPRRITSSPTIKHGGND